MPQTPDQPSDLDTQLQNLQQQMADLGFVLSTVIALRKEAFRVLQLLPDELRQLKEQIARLLPLLPQ